MTAKCLRLPQTEFSMTTESTPTGAVPLSSRDNAATTDALPRNRAGWFGAFALDRGRVVLRKTGNSAPLSMGLASEVASWLLFQMVLQVLSALRRAGRPAGPAIWFAPDRPGPWYMVRAAAAWAGVRIAATPDQADASFFFEDATMSHKRHSCHQRSYNFGCTDISKSRVAAVFAEVFGYPLALDPLKATGRAVEKGEANGAHDGRIVHCPTPPLSGKTYQRLIDTVEEDGCARDLRTHCIAGRPVIVWVKRRAADQRFLPPNLSVTVHEPANIFSPAEMTLISQFAAAMQLDWGGLDILRDRLDGRIYIVDVNKTDAGPITSLTLRDKIRSTAVLANALSAMLAMPLPVECRTIETLNTVSQADPM